VWPRAFGPRVRPPGVCSRFGIELGEGPTLVRVARSLSAVPDHVDLGVHFHYAQSTIGTRRWNHLVRSCVYLASSLQEQVGRGIRTMDIGGGWTPTAFDVFCASEMAELEEFISRVLPNCNEIIVEPGKALTAPCGFVVTHVLQVIDAGLAVVDAAIAEMPDQVSLPRSVYVRRRSGWRELPRGEGCLVGRTCIEGDVVAIGLQLDDLEAGDVLIFNNAGAYDASMRYRFATGGAR